MKAKSEEDREPGVMADKQNYVLLLKELHSAFAPHGFLLTAAVSPGKPTIDRAYDVPQLSRYLDIINLMSYDFHVGKENKTGDLLPLLGVSSLIVVSAQHITHHFIHALMTVN